MGDADLNEKEEALNDIRRQILELEQKREALWAGHLIKDRVAPEEEEKKEEEE